MSALIPVNQIQIFRDATPNVMALKLQELEVTQYWSVIFSPQGIASLTKQDITGFMSYRQNHRWKEISREDVAVDMDRLRTALLVLMDESRPISERMNSLEAGRGELAIAHLGKAKLTPLLMVKMPKRYGVWNEYSQRALTGMNIMPEFAENSRLGDQYTLVNDILLHLSAEYRVSLWWLDIILERIARLVR